MGADGYIDHLLYQGAITAVLMKEFIANKILLYYMPYLGLR